MTYTLPPKNKNTNIQCIIYHIVSKVIWIFSSIINHLPPSHRYQGAGGNN